MAASDNQKPFNSRSFVAGMVVGGIVLASFLSGAITDRLFVISPLDRYIPREGGVGGPLFSDVTQRILNEESAVIEVAENSSPAVVTVSITTQRQVIDPFGGFFGGQIFRQRESETIQRDIGTGFVVDGDQGLIVTNKHVVGSADASYRIITKDDQEYQVERIYRDPVNDLAILKVNARLPALELGDSDNLKVGQFVIAIGTALGEFRHTVTTGVVSGLGRGITAGSGFGGATEELDDVIQTDAAINPGNSGGPLLNSAGQVIGVSVAIASGSENIGFAIPINVIKSSLENFNATGQFDRPFLGVRYRMIPRETALMNDVPEGAYVVEVMEQSSASAAGLEEGDIIVRLDGKAVSETTGGLAAIINELKVGQETEAEVFREDERITIPVTMRSSEE
jgi:serine protease Do